MRPLILFLLLLVTAPVAAEPVRHASRMVATASPQATEAALATLRAGGSAVDAAIAAQAVLSVVEPHASGIFGGAFLLVWDRARAQLRFYEGIASAPAGSADRLAAEGAGAATVARSGRAVAVPGAMAALALAHAQHGRLAWANLFQPAIALAEDGFPLPPYLAQVLRARAVELRRVPALRALYFDADGAPRAAGTLLRNPEQAAALRLLATEGAGAIHGGALGDALLAAVADHALPGWMTRADLLAYRAVERDPLCAEIFARRICTAAPPSSGGVAVLQTLAIAERLGLAREAAGSVAATHLFLEASRLANADRRRWIGDPDRVSVPVAGLLDARYLDSRAALASADRAMAQVAAGTPPTRHGALPPASDPLAEAATTQVSILDGLGDAVAFTTTNNLNFGAELVAMGASLNNGMTNFATAPGSNANPAQNRLEPGKRPVTTMAPSIVFGADGTPEIVIGAGGGARIPDAVSAALLALLAQNRDAYQATAQPRFGAQAGLIELEQGTPVADQAPALTALGHAPRVVVMNTGLQIVRRLADGTLEGAADPRRDGTAAGN